MKDHACRIDEALPFKPVNIALLTVSDTRDDESDTSGALLADLICPRRSRRRRARACARRYRRHSRRGWARGSPVREIDVVITTGGTGLTGRDVTPEALRPLFEKEIEGFAVVWHMLSFESVGLSTLQSRACAGVAHGKFIFALPGSNGACRDGWEKIIRWQLDSRHTPCNLVEIMPRLLER